MGAYDTLFEKTATRAWKKHMFNLSPEDILKLRKKGVINYQKEIDGLNYGTDAILRKLKAVVYNNDAKKFSNDTVRLTWQDPLGKKLKADSALNYRNKLLKMHEAVGGFAGIYRPDGTAIVNKGDTETLINFVKNKTGFSQYLKPSEKKYIEAIANRHEADELLARAKSYSNPNLHIKRNGTKRTLTDFGSHSSPEVVIKESANVAIAPESAKNFLTRVRDYSGDRIELARMGVPFAKSGVYNKKDAIKATKEVVKNKMHL